MSALEKLLADSRRGCITEWAEIAKIVKRVARISVGEMLEILEEENVKCVRWVAEVLVEEYELSEDAVEQIRYAELLCMLDQSESTPPQRNFRYEGIWHLYYYLFFKSRRRDFRLELFLSVSVRELFRYLESVCRDGSAAKLHEDFLRKTAAEINDSTNIGDLLEKTEDARRTCWLPWKPLPDYRKKMLDTCDIYIILLLEIFRTVCPDDFDLETITIKYRFWC